jgi:hypothetical protein
VAAKDSFPAKSDLSAATAEPACGKLCALSSPDLFRRPGEHPGSNSHRRSADRDCLPIPLCHRRTCSGDPWDVRVRALAHTLLCHRRTCSGDPWDVQGSAFTRDDRESVPLLSLPARAMQGWRAEQPRRGGASVRKMVERDTRPRDNSDMCLAPSPGSQLNQIACRPGRPCRGAGSLLYAARQHPRHR